MELREKKQKRCQAHEAEVAGDLWDHTAVTADSKLVVSLVGGKRTQAQTRALVHDAKRRLRPGHLPVIFTDLTRAMRPPSWRHLDGVTLSPGPRPKAGCLALSSAGRKAWPMGR